MILEEDTVSGSRHFVAFNANSSITHRKRLAAMSTGILKVQGDKVVGNDGKAVVLRGAGLGGWMNMENVRLS